MRNQVIRNLPKVAISIAIAVLVTALTVSYIRTQHSTKKLDSDLKQLQLEKEKIELEKVKSIEEKNKKIEQLQKDLQSKADSKAAQASLATKVVQNIVPVAKAAEVAPSEPTESAKMFIYMKESGNRTNAINPSSGACGLGQALPCSKMPCSLSDYACQDQFFTQYMINRYGTWENAKAFWLSHRWW